MLGFHFFFFGGGHFIARGEIIFCKDFCLGGVWRRDTMLSKNNNPNKQEVPFSLKQRTTGAFLVTNGFISLIKYQKASHFIFIYLFLYFLLLIVSGGGGEISVRQDTLEFKFLSIPLGSWWEKKTGGYNLNLCFSQIVVSNLCVGTKIKCIDIRYGV